MKKPLYLLSAVCFCLGLMACQSSESAIEQADKVELTVCPEARPQICTMEYMPVCGSNSNGTSKTYGNACSACGDVEVAGYVVGACEADDEK